MNRDEQLPPIFADGSICVLDAYVLRTTRTPPRIVGNATWGRSISLSEMTARELVLRLDDALYTFEEARGAIRYVPDALRRPRVLESCVPSRVIAIRRIVTRRALTLLLIDERLEKVIAAVGDTLALCLEGLDVRFTTDRDEPLHEM